MILYQLFLVFFQVGLFSIGGGLAAIPLIQEQIVSQHAWMTLAEFTDLITIAQMTPGPIAINSATFIGLRLGGPLGAIISTIACILPGAIIVMVLAYFYNRHQQVDAIQALLNSLKPAVVAFIASAGLSILQSALTDTSQVPGASFDYISLILFLVAFLILRKFKPNPIYTMLGTGLVGACIYLLI